MCLCGGVTKSEWLWYLAVSIVRAGAASISYVPSLSGKAMLVSVRVRDDSQRPGSSDGVIYIPRFFPKSISADSRFSYWGRRLPFFGRPGQARETRNATVFVTGKLREDAPGVATAPITALAVRS